MAFLRVRCKHTGLFLEPNRGCVCVCARARAHAHIHMSVFSQGFYSPVYPDHSTFHVQKQTHDLLLSHIWSFPKFFNLLNGANYSSGWATAETQELFLILPFPSIPPPHLHTIHQVL